MQELLLYLENVLRATLLRFHASPESLKRIFQVTSALYKRYNAHHKSGGKEVSANTITGTVLEILSDGLRGKVRIPSSTISSILEVRTPERPTPPKALMSVRWLLTRKRISPPNSWSDTRRMARFTFSHTHPPSTSPRQTILPLKQLQN